MTASLFRRGGRALLDDAVDRVRRDAFAFALLHVLPSLPFFAAALWWFVRIDLHGAMPRDDAEWLPLLMLPRIVGWGALAAWSGAAARGRPVGPLAAWGIALRRLPEVLALGALYLLAVLAGTFTLVGFVGVAVALTALAATVSDARPGSLASLRQAAGARTEDLGRSFTILVCSFLAWVFIALNLWLLPVVLVALGAGGFGLDVSLVANAFSLERAATLAFAGLTATLLLEGVLVIAFAELQRDREAEREGTRFETFAEELERKAAARTRTPEGAVA